MVHFEMGSQARLDYFFGKANLNPFSWILREILPSDHTHITNSIWSSYDDFQMNGFILGVLNVNIGWCLRTWSCNYLFCFLKLLNSFYHLLLHIGQMSDTNPPQRSSALCRMEHTFRKANLSTISATSLGKTCEITSGLGHPEDLDMVSIMGRSMYDHIKLSV